MGSGGSCGTRRSRRHITTTDHPLADPAEAGRATFPLRIQLPGSFGPAAAIATSVAIPPRARLPMRPAVVFAYPGGGYTRAYFDLRPPGRGEGYSMAAAMAARGLIVVAFDNLGCGESSPSPGTGRSGTGSILAAGHHVVEVVLSLARRGDLHPRLPPIDPGLTVGLGHSMGAGLVTAQQAETRDFDGLVLLGRSVGATHVPAPPAAGERGPVWKALSVQYAEIEASATVVTGGLRQEHLTPWQRFLYHWDDVPDDVADFGESILTTFPVGVARELGGREGRNAQAAGLVDVPMLLAFGERDVSRSPALEAAKYPSAASTVVTVLPRSGHAHNFASTRALLWQTIVDWITDHADGESKEP